MSSPTLELPNEVWYFNAIATPHTYATIPRSGDKC